jgi:deoxyribonuclease V
MAEFFWTTDREAAIKEQQTLLNLLKTENALPQLPNFELGAAIGSAYEENTKMAFATAVFFNKNGRCCNQIEQAHCEVDFPYTPGLLVFRVGPAICMVLNRIIDKLELLLFDGQGIAHERGFGLASHIGVLYNKPSIGVTKNILYGKCNEPPKERFAYTDILHPKKKAVIGYALSLGGRCQPCYVSPGHGIDLETSIKIICNISGNSCFPFPIKKAHALANKSAKEYWQRVSKGL